jgi:UDP-glucose 4-epimerase
MTILILGATGFIGSAVLNRAQALGLDVVATTRVETQGFSVCDVTKPMQVIELLGATAFKVVINCVGAGATAGQGSDEEVWQVNALGTKNVIDALSSIDLSVRPRFVHLGSSREQHIHLSMSDRGATTKSYADSKRESATLIETFAGMGNVAWNLRVHNTYGPNQPQNRMVARIVESAVAGVDAELKNPNQIHDFVHVSDVAEAVVRAAQSDIAPQQSIEIGTGVGTSVLKLARMVYALAGAPQELIQFDPDARAGRPEVADLSMATELLGWEPSVDLMSGLTEQLLAPRQAAQGQAAQDQAASAPSAGSIREAMFP